MNSVRLYLSKGICLAVLVLTVIAIACADSSTPPPSPTSPPKTEGLIDRAMARSDAYINGNWMTMYNYVHPEQRAGCTVGEYALERGLFYRELADVMGIPEEAKQSGLFRLMHGLDEEAQLESRVEEIRRTGNQAFVDIDDYHNGKHIDWFMGEVRDVGTYWEYFEGEWYVTNESLEC